ncbi:MAG: glycosyltransferase family 4 protein [Rhodoferax sp.]
MRITFLLPADNLTGGNRVVAIYARQLRQLGHEVLVVCCAPERLSLRAMARAVLRRDGAALRQHFQPLPGHIAISGVPCRVLERPRAITAADVPDADVIIATWWETALWMHAMPAAKGKKVHLIQGYEVWLNPACQAQVQAALRLPNQKIAISADLKHTLETEAGLQGVQVIANAVDLTQFNAPPRQRQAVPTVGFVYAHAAIKGADICIRACELARARLPGLKVLAFGADQPAESLALPSGTEFHYRPAQAELKTIYARCDAWLFGSRLDSFGLPILEAMACRTPVIAVPIGAAPELLADGAGLLVAKESPQAMADAIVALCHGISAAAWCRHADLAHQKAHSYSWEDASRALLAALEQPA